MTDTVTVTGWKQKTWRIRVARQGHKDRVPTVALRRQVRALRRRGWTLTAVAEAVGVSEQALSWACTHGCTVHHRTAEAVEDLFEEHCSRPPRDERRWPSEPIREAVLAKYGSLKASGWRRDVARIRAKGDVSTDTAERWAERLGLLPYELWPDWATYGLEEAV